LDVKVIDGPASSFSARFGYTQYHRMRERLHGPPPKERRIPRARMR
jgi:hypothetical protein